MQPMNQGAQTRQIGLPSLTLNILSPMGSCYAKWDWEWNWSASSTNSSGSSDAVSNLIPQGNSSYYATPAIGNLEYATILFSTSPKGPFDNVLVIFMPALIGGETYLIEGEGVVGLKVTSYFVGWSFPSVTVDLFISING
jgi:hypothetical protein